MSKIEAIKQQIQSLSREEFAQLREWLWELGSLLPPDAEQPVGPHVLLDAEESEANSGQLVEDVMAKLRKNL
jgi:hypothetical protein